MYGSFNDRAQEAWDFVRCQRADGTFYGSPSGRCKKGTPVGDDVGKEEKKTHAKRDPSKDVKRGNTLIGTSPRNMSIDNLNAVKKEYEDYKKKFGNRPDLKNVMDAYEKRIADAERNLEKKDKPKRKRATSVEKEEAKLAKLEQRLAAADEKVASARSSVTTARARSRTKLMTSAGRRAGSAADRAITKQQELSRQVREQRAKVNEMKGIKPKVEEPAPRTAKDDRRDKLRETIDSINSRAKRLAEGKGRDSDEYKRFVRKYGNTLTKLMDERQKLGF